MEMSTMADPRLSYERFAATLREKVQAMAQDGVPRDQVQAFIDRKKSEWSAAENASRAKQLEDVEAANTVGSAIGSGVKEWAGNWKDRLVAMAQGGKKLGSMVASPVESYRNLRDVPEARRELGRGLSDSLLGLPAWLGDKAGITHYAETAEHDASVANDPRVANMRGAGGIAGAAAMLPAGGLAKNLVAKLPGSMGAKTLAAIPVTATVGGAVHGAVDPQERVLPSRNPDGTIEMGSMLAAATDPTAAAVALGVRGAEGMSNLLRKNKTIGRYARDREAGIYDSPEMKALPKGPEGIQKAREIGQKRVAAREVELDQQHGDAYRKSLGELRRPEPGPVEWVDGPVVRGDQMAQLVEDIAGPGDPGRSSLFEAARRIDAPGAEPGPKYRPQIPVRGEAPPPEGLARPIDRNMLARELGAARASRLSPDTGQPYVGAKNTANKLRELADVFERDGQWVDDVQSDYGRRYEPPVDTVGGALGQRRALQKEAAFRSTSPTPEQLAAQEAYQALRGAIRKAAPDVGAADDAYSAYARQADRRRDILYRSEDNVVKGGGQHPDAPDIEFADELGQEPPQMRVGKEQAAATTLGRIEDTNVEGLRVAKYLDELAQQDPAFAQALDFIASKKALEGTRFSAEGMLPTSLTGAVSAGGLLPTIRQNVRALGARVVDPAADLIGRGVGPGALAVNPILQAYAAQKERERKMAALLGGGG